MPIHRVSLLVAVLAALVVMSMRTWIVGDARWWNLAMAGLLLVVLGLYLWNERAPTR
jgi:hypothetical protein